MTRKVDDQARWLADKLASQDKKIASLQTRGELAYSSIEDGSIVEKDLEGNLVASVGKQHDGSHVAVPYTGPTPAAPVAASLKAVPGVVEVRWSGKFTGNAVSAMDFKHVSVHVSTTPAVDATPSTQVATIRGELGDVATVTAVEGMLYVVLVAWSTAGKASAPSPVAAVAVPGAVDEAWIQDKLDDIDERYDGVITDAGNLGTRLSTAETELVDHDVRLAAADSALSTLTGTTLPALSIDLTAAKARLTAAEGTLAPLPGQLATAQTALTLLKDTTVPALSIDLTAAKARLTTAEGTLASNQTAINTTLPASVKAAKDAADMALLIAPVSTATPVLADGTGRPIGAIWTRIDGSGNEIGYWRWTASGWVTQALTTAVIPNLAASKITSGTIAAARIDTAALAVQLALIIELNADRITAGKITSAQVDTTNLAAALATILSLNADRITAGTINTARLNVSELAVAIANVIQLNASAITAGTIATARLNVTDLAANLATILSLNADRITAGTINVARLNTVAIAAATAAFQTVDVKNLFATTGTMAEAVITKLWTDVVMSRKITAQMIAVGAFDNLNGDQNFVVDDYWNSLSGGAGSGFVTPPSAVPDASTRVALLTPKTAQTTMTVYNCTLATANRIPVTPGDYYNCWSYVISDVDDSTMTSVSQQLYFYDAAGTLMSTGNVMGGRILKADWILNTWNKVGGTNVQVPVGAVSMTPRLTVYKPNNSAPTSAKYWVSPPHITRAMGGELIVDGSVKARSLESQLVLATDIIAGNPLGTHAKMNANGFRVLASADGGTPTEVIRMGTDTDDYFGVANATGELVASITSGGDLSAQSGDFANDISIAGTPLADTLSNLPQGLVSWGSRSSNSLYWAGTTVQPFLHLQFEAAAGRAYMVQTTAITLDTDTDSTDGLVKLHYNEAGSIATVAAPVIAEGLAVQGSAKTRRSPVTISRLIQPPAGDTALLVSYGTVSSGRSKIVATGSRAVILTVMDIGPQVPMTGEAPNGSGDAAVAGTGGGSGTPPPVVKNYDKTWNATGTRSFVGSGDTYAYNTGYMYSGLSPAGYGDLSSMAIFGKDTSGAQTILEALAGATVTAVGVYVYYDFWYQGSGGSAYIGLHGWASLTSSKPVKTYAHALSSSWPRAAGRWVWLSASTYAGFKSGTHRGITLGGSGGGLERYGYAHNPRIRIKYTK